MSSLSPGEFSCRLFGSRALPKENEIQATQVKSIGRNCQLKRAWLISCPQSKRQLLYSFLVPFSIMLLAFFLAGIPPFGNRNLMAMDAYNQYFPMLR